MMIEVNPTNVAYRMYNQLLNYHQISSCPKGHIHRRSTSRPANENMLANFNHSFIECNKYKNRK